MDLKRPFLKNNLMISDIYTEKTINDGKIDQLRIFPSALTTAQMTQLYNEA